MKQSRFLEQRERPFIRIGNEGYLWMLDDMGDRLIREVDSGRFDLPTVDENFSVDVLPQYPAVACGLIVGGCLRPDRSEDPITTMVCERPIWILAS